MPFYANTDDADSLTGTADDDSFDVAFGSLGAGRDLFYGYGGRDWLHGGLGRDTLYGGNDGDGLFGGNDDDLLYGGDGDDRLSGGTGNDTIFGGNGFDDLTFAFGVTMTIGSGITTVTTGSFQITFSGIESFQLANFANDVTGGVRDDRIWGGTGNDTLRGMDGDDSLLLGDGNDLAMGGDGDDHLTGNVSTGNDRAFGGAGNDVIFLSAGNDTAYGGIGDDNLLQGSEGFGDDLYYGDAGNDFVQSAGGADSLYGGTGNDTLSLTALHTLTIDLRLSSQIVMVDDVGVFVESFENVALTAARTRAIGNTLANTFGTSGGDDVVIAFAGNDTIRFGQGIDSVYGGNGDDFIDHNSYFGPDAAKDTGADLLSGGAGADTFRFLSQVSSPFGTTRRDTITDFTRGADKVDLSQFYDAEISAAEKIKFTFIGNSTYTVQRGELRFANGVLQGDVNGDGITDFAVNMTGITALSAADLIL